MLLYDRNIIGSFSKIFGYLRKSLLIFGNFRKMFGKRLSGLRTTLGESSETWKVFGNLRKIAKKSSLIC